MLYITITTSLALHVMRVSADVGSVTTTLEIVLVCTSVIVQSHLWYH